MSGDINLNDIAEQLLIVDKRTIDHLFSLDSPADCVALYMFFYKTAKWQKTRSIKAADTYIRKCLGWGAKRVTDTKKLLEDAGLIKKVSRRNGGKITGHFIEVAYLFHQNTRKPEHSKTTSGFGETNAYRDNIKCLENISNNKTTKVVLGETPQDVPVENSNVVVRSQRSLDIDEAFDIWNEIMGYRLQANKTDRRAVNSILSRKGMDLGKLRVMIRLVAESQHDRYKRFSITDYTDLLYKTNDLMAWAREKQAQRQQTAKITEV